jgi:nucleoside-diphosphate-sugar epimerase
LTGAAGGIGTAIAPMLRERWALILTDIAPGVADVLDVTDGDQCRQAFAGADAVVHLAAVADPEASWETLHGPNIVGAYQVARAAMDCHVRRLVLASSLQAVSGYPAERQRRTTDAARPVNLYGATKAWAEALGAWVAASSQTSVVALRLGYFPGTRLDPDSPDQDRKGWLSPRDCAELVRCAVEADDVSFVVANGVSANRYSIADLSDTAARLGYQPADDAWSDTV